MHLHIVGGFLGSGKTTAIINASRRIMERGQTVGVITNDQGKYLVDTAFVRASDIPAVEVTGGCFCCNYEDLQARLDQLRDSARPDTIFAESVGSCADVVATVMKPLMELHASDGPPPSFSVFADIRLLRRRLLGMPLPFSEKVTYLFDKQIEEAGLIVVNKADSIAPELAEETVRMARNRFPGRPVRLQNSLDPADTAAWLDLIESGTIPAPGPSLDIDYTVYGSGERELAWLDERIVLTVQPGDARNAVMRFIGAASSEFVEHGIPVGHLKFLVTAGGATVKVSLTGGDDEGPSSYSIPETRDTEVDVLVNARAETAPHVLRDIIGCALDRSGADYRISAADAFQPGFPNPTHRMP